MKIKPRHPEKVKNPVNPIKKKPDWIRSKLINSKEFFSTNVSNIKGGDFDSREIAGLRSYDKMIKHIMPQLEKSLFLNYVNN